MPWQEVSTVSLRQEFVTLVQQGVVSLRSFPATLPPITYPRGMAVRQVQQGGQLSFRGRTLRVPKAFAGYPVGVQPTALMACSRCGSVSIA